MQPSFNTNGLMAPLFEDADAETLELLGGPDRIYQGETVIAFPRGGRRLSGGETLLIILLINISRINVIY